MDIKLQELQPDYRGAITEVWSKLCSIENQHSVVCCNSCFSAVTRNSPTVTNQNEDRAEKGPQIAGHPSGK